jgi:hypothetical protein
MPQIIETTETPETPKPDIAAVYEDVEQRAKARIKTRFYDSLKLLWTALTEATAIAVVVFFVGFLLDGTCS